MSKIDIYLLDDSNNTITEANIIKPKTYQELLNQIKIKFQILLSKTYKIFILNKNNEEIEINNDEKYKLIENVIFIKKIDDDNLRLSIFEMNYNKLEKSKKQILNEKYKCLLCDSIIKNEEPYLCYECQKIFHEKCLKDLDDKYKSENKKLSCPNCKKELPLEQWNKKLNYEDYRNESAIIMNEIKEYKLNNNMINNMNKIKDKKISQLKEEINRQNETIKAYTKYMKKTFDIFKNILIQINSIHSFLKLKANIKLNDILKNFSINLNFKNLEIDSISKMIYDELKEFENCIKNNYGKDKNIELRRKNTLNFEKIKINDLNLKDHSKIFNKKEFNKNKLLSIKINDDRDNKDINNIDKKTKNNLNNESINNKKKNNETDLNKNKIYNNLLLLSVININIEKIKYQMDNDEINNKDNYYIINNDLINYLKTCYDYGNISKKINIKKYLEIIKSNKNYDENILIEEINKEILNININDLNNIKINNKEKIDIPENLEIKDKIEKLNIGNNNEKSFINKFTIINGKIKEKIENIFILNSPEKYMLSTNCLKNKNYIYFFYKLNQINFISLGVFNPGFIYETKIVLEINKSDIFEEILKTNIINQKIELLINDLLKYNNAIDKQIIYKLVDEDPLKDKNNIPIIKNEIKDDINIDILETEIKGFIKYILFIKNLQNEIECSQVSIFIKHYPKIYLINHIWISEFNNIIEKLKPIVEEEIKNSTPINNSREYDDYLINVVYLLFIGKYKESFDKKTIETIINKLEDGKKFELNFNKNVIKNKNVEFPNNFDIVDSFIFEALTKRNNKINKNNYESEIIINDQNIILKYDKNNNSKNDTYNLIVGKITENDNIFEEDIILIYNNKEKSSKDFEVLKTKNYNDIKNSLNTDINLINYELKDNGKKNQNLLNKASDNIEMNLNKNNIPIKLIKIFIVMFLYENDINKIIKSDIKSNQICFYYIINKEWMKIYKEFYEFNKFSEYIKSFSKKEPAHYEYYSSQIMKSIDQSINNYNRICDDLVYELIKQVPPDYFKKLNQKKDDQQKLISNLNKYDTSLKQLILKVNEGQEITYFGENELIRKEILDIMNILESDTIFDSIRSKSQLIQCLIGENKLYIISDNNQVLNVGYIQDNIFTPSLLIYYQDKILFNKFINQIKNDSFNKYIENYNLIDYREAVIKDSNYINIGNIYRVSHLSDELKNIILKDQNDLSFNNDAYKILSLIVYFIKLKYELNSVKINNEKKLGYLVKKEFFDKIKQLKLYQIINDYVSKNIYIPNIINNNIDKSIEKLLYYIIKEFDVKTIKKINSHNENININCNEYDVEQKQVKLSENRYVNYLNNFILLNEEIYKLFKDSIFINNYYLYYFIGENRIFSLYNDNNNKALYIYNINGINEFNLDLIFYFNNMREIVLEEIKKNGFKNFSNYLLFDNEYISPIFDKNENKIGTAYKFFPKIKDYTLYRIDLKIGRMLILYSYYQKLKSNLLSENNKKAFKEYYIINKNWIQIYKNFFDFDILYKHLESNTFINEELKTIKDIYKISDQKLTLMIKKLPLDLRSSYNEKQRDFLNKYNNNELKIPGLSPCNYIDQHNKEKSIIIYDNFEIIDIDTYEKLFKDLNKNLDYESEKKILLFSIKGKDTLSNQEEKVECLFDKKRVIIQLKNTQNEDIKGILYIGQLNSSFTFYPEIFFIYDSESKMNEHINKIIKKHGFNDFCEEFMKEPNDIKVLEIDKKKYGFAIKKKSNIIINPNLYNGSIRNCFKYSPKIGMIKIGTNNYMNATLQCFCQIEEFAYYFKYNIYVNQVMENYKKKSKLCLVSSFKKLMEEIWPQNSMEYDPLIKNKCNPNELGQKVSDITKLSKGNEINNIKKLINFIIKTLHEELNQPIANNNTSNSINKNNNIKNNQMAIFNIFYQDYMNNYRSKISDLFYSIQQIHTSCLKCKYMQYSFKAYYFLEFNLEEVKKFSINKINEQNNFAFNTNNMNNNINNLNLNTINNKINNIQNGINNQNNIRININNINNKINLNMNTMVSNNYKNNFIVNNNNIKLQKLNNNIINIYDCFSFIEKREILSGNNQINCQNCNSKSDADQVTYLTTSPKNLILIFNRENNIQQNIKLEFEPIIDLSYFVKTRINNVNIKYELIGAITFLDEDKENGHFIAHCLSPIDRKWYTYNDAIVYEVNNFLNDVIEPGKPYCLFYKKLKMN